MICTALLSLPLAPIPFFALCAPHAFPSFFSASLLLLLSASRRSLSLSLSLSFHRIASLPTHTDPRTQPHQAGVASSVPARSFPSRFLSRTFPPFLPCSHFCFHIHPARARHCMKERLQTVCVVWWIAMKFRQRMRAACRCLSKPARVGKGSP